MLLVAAQRILLQCMVSPMQELLHVVHTYDGMLEAPLALELQEGWTPWPVSHGIPICTLLCVRG
jgi:hypothetical protein